MKPDRVEESTTLLDLEWNRLAWAVASRCKGPRRERPFVPIADTYEQTERALAETREALMLVRQGDAIPLDGIEDIEPSLARLERDGVLDAPALRDLKSTLGAARRLRSFLGRRRALTPFLDRVCATDPTLDQLEDEISFSITDDGTIQDDATPELKQLRVEVGNLRQRIVRRLEQLIHKHGSILQDGFYTIREGRYVLPLRSDSHEKFDGIVHGSSASGATLFVEPKELVDRGNRLKMAHSELAREEQRILAALSDHVRQHVHAVRQAVVALDHADLKAASAQLAIDLNGEVPELTEGSHMRLVQARHPLLVLDGVDVVPNDLHIEAPHALVLSGPNAGGKTVVLKTIGLAALMTRAGLPLAAAEDSVSGFFQPVLSALGDEQSLERSLSTFSAHVMKIAGILDEARERVLVLLDELMSGTEPEAGAGLACAVTKELVERGAAVVVTTHYEALKAFVAGRTDMTNAAVGFDLQRMEPTFEIAFGVPGASNALDVAGRYGLQDAVINVARSYLRDDSQGFEALADELRRATELAAERASALERDAQSVAAMRARLKAKEAKLAERERRRFSEHAAQLARRIREVEGELRHARRALREEQDERSVAAARRAVTDASRVLSEVHDEAAAPPPVVEDNAAVAVGDRVWVQHLRCEADVVEGPVRDKVRVAAGMMRLWVDADKVRKTKAGEQQPSAEPRPAARAEAGASARSSVPLRTPHNTIDVRGLSVDDAVSMTESFLDQMYGAAEGSAFIVHGVGSGALRAAIHSHLSNDQTYVANFEQASNEHGGAQVTIVTLR